MNQLRAALKEESRMKRNEYLRELRKREEARAKVFMETLKAEKRKAPSPPHNRRPSPPRKTPSPPRNSRQNNYQRTINKIKSNHWKQLLHTAALQFAPRGGESVWKNKVTRLHMNRAQRQRKNSHAVYWPMPANENYIVWKSGKFSGLFA